MISEAYNESEGPSPFENLQRAAVQKALENYRVEEPTSALAAQVGGTHYKGFAIQPVEFIYANSIPFIEACAIKYLCRWRDKGGIADLEKARHYIDMLIELETKKGLEKAV